MGTTFNEVTLEVVKGAVNERTRMEAVKAMFYAFRDRAELVGRGFHQMGLVQFDNEVEQLLDLTPHLELFEAIVDDVEPRGLTAIYSSIIQAARMLQGHFQQDGSKDFRVVVLTDGQNNTGAPPVEALEAVGAIGAVVDAIIVGNSPDSSLRKIVTATGGECWQINDLGEGFELLEAEGVVSLKARRGGAEKPPFQPPTRVDFGALEEKSITRGTNVQRVVGLPAELAKKAVVSVDKVKEGSVKAEGRSAGATRRLLSELKKVSSGDGDVWLHSGEGVHLFPAGDSLDFWRALIEGPKGSPFEGGTFVLNIVIPHDYPFKPPSVSFETPVYHCNVNDSGRICLDILQEKWNPALSIPKVVEAIRLMLSTPNTDDALRQWIAELTIAHDASGGADTRYYEKAREATARDACMTVAEWRQRWGC
jgi:ubiquitin-conjugating enzyme E2 D/E